MPHLRLVREGDDNPRAFALRKISVALEALALPDARPVDRSILSELRDVAEEALAE